MSTLQKCIFESKVGVTYREKIMNFQITGGNPGAKIYTDNRRCCGGVLFFDVNMQLEREDIPERFSILFSMPDVEVYSVWSPGIQADRHSALTGESAR